VAFCYTESQTGVDVTQFETFYRSSYGTSNKCILNGKKSWVSLLTTDPSDTLENDKDVLFVVIARTKFDNKEELELISEKVTSENANEQFKVITEREAERLNAFLIDRREHNADQILLRKKLTNFNGLNLYDIEFRNIETGEDNLLGKDGDGFDMTQDLTVNARYLVGVICVGLLKNLFRTTIDYTINTRQFRRNIYNYPIIKQRLCNIEKRLYAMESMCYMTAGVQDSYEIPDISMESAATKIFCTENLIKSVNDCMEIMAMSAYSKLDDMMHRNLNDVNFLMTMLNTNDMLRNYISINGLTQAGIDQHSEIKKLRSPLQFPGFVLSQNMNK
jgi:alkylation response protein AidB-like acyl-CoA dehydrogenase